jgi:phenylalanine-4-hydroxylase
MNDCSAATGWQLARRLIPRCLFFTPAGQPQIPGDRLIRTSAEFDYIVEPGHFFQ